MNNETGQILPTEQARQISTKYNVPLRINLYTRAKQCETVLDLVGAVICSDYLYESEFNYRIGASYPYQLTGKEGEYKAIDFSEGPMLCVGDVIGKSKMKVVEIDPPIITCIKS